MAIMAISLHRICRFSHLAHLFSSAAHSSQLFLHFLPGREIKTWESNSLCRAQNCQHSELLVQLVIERSGGFSTFFVAIALDAPITYKGWSGSAAREAVSRTEERAKIAVESFEEAPDVVNIVGGYGRVVVASGKRWIFNSAVGEGRCGGGQPLWSRRGLIERRQSVGVFRYRLRGCCARERRHEDATSLALPASQQEQPPRSTLREHDHIIAVMMRATRYTSKLGESFA